MRTTAHINADHINWTLIASSTSDEASTQKKFNKLLQNLISRDETHEFGPADNSITEVSENKCGMHLGVNLLKAQNNGISQYEKSVCAHEEDNFELTTRLRRSRHA